MWRQSGWALRGPQFLLDDRAARYIEGFLNQARLVMIGCLLVLANVHLLPGSLDTLVFTMTAAGVVWMITLVLLTRYAYRPWIAIAFSLVDLGFVSALVYLTGGPSSPLDALYAILIFAAVIRFTRLYCLLFTLAVILAYAAVVLLHPDFVGEIDGNTLLTRSVVLAATGVLAWLIGAEVARQRRAVVETQQQLASLRAITHIARRLGAAHDIGEIHHTVTALVDELVHPNAVAVSADERDTILKGMWAAGCAEVIVTPVGPSERPNRWIYAGCVPSRTLSLADRALVQCIADEAAAALERTELLQRERDRSESLAQLVDENQRLLAGERETVGRLKQLATHKEGFIDMVAHELRTPLTSVKGFAQLMLRGAAGGRAGRYAEFIVSESNRLMRIIDDIVDLSRMERGLLEMNHESIDVAELLREVMALLAPIAVPAVLTLPEALPRIRGDREKLCQTFVNVVQAGALYHRGTDPMTLGAAVESKAVRIWLAIDGTIPNRQLAHVFDPVPRATEPPRSGLALYICRNFIEAHGGRLWIEQNADHACLLLSIPAASEPLPTGRPVGRPQRHACVQIVPFSSRRSAALRHQRGKDGG